MSQRYRLLSHRIRLELDELARTRKAIERDWLRSATAGVDQDAFVNSAALHLHSFYSGIERILRLIAEEFDGGVLGGDSWHSELLKQMQFDVPGTRPSVLSSSSVSALEEYRRFRHLIRNIYATNILPERMETLVKRLPEVWDAVSGDLSGFAVFIDQIADAV